jgi:hypothetical protein
MVQQLTDLTITLDLLTNIEPKNNFKTALTQAIDEVLTSLGENVKQATYSYIESKCKISKHQIPGKLDAFTSGLESLFGNAAVLVEIKIMEKLQSKAIGFMYKSNGREIFFADYLNALQQHMDWQDIVPNI